MSDTTSNTYFVKALDNYPFDLEQTIESLNYALSYDENNADVHCLMAEFYLNELNDFEAAQHHLEEALANNINHIKSYYCFIKLYIIIEDYKKATNLIDFANTVKGISKTFLNLQRALILEKQGKLIGADLFVRNALTTCICEDELHNLKNVLNRIKYKMKLGKPKMYSKKVKKNKKKQK